MFFLWALLLFAFHGITCTAVPPAQFPDSSPEQRSTGLLPRKADNRPVTLPILTDWSSGNEEDQADHKLFVASMEELLRSIEKNLGSRNFEKVLPRWFQKGNEKKVRRVFEAILGKKPKNRLGAEFLSKVTIALTLKTASVLRTCVKTPNMLAFTNSHTNTIYPCPRAFDFKRLEEITCTEVGTRVSDTMLSFSSIILGELLKLDQVGKAVLGAAISDIEQGPYDAFRLNSEDQEGSLLNAGNYVRFSAELIWMEKCNRKEAYDYPDEETSRWPEDTKHWAEMRDKVAERKAAEAEKAPKKKGWRNALGQ